MGTVILIHVNRGRRITKYTQKQKHMLLKNSSGFGVIGNHVNDLLRMRKEGKTDYSHKNPYFVSKIQEEQSINLLKFNGRFVSKWGKMEKIKYSQKRREADLLVSSA